jgi:hypothetical protein
VAATCCRRMFLSRWTPPAHQLSVSAGVVFLVGMVPPVPLTPGLGREGARKGGAGGETSGEPWGCGEGCPRGFPPPSRRLGCF